LSILFTELYDKQTRAAEEGLFGNVNARVGHGAAPYDGGEEEID
jgi:hypothetical protein